MVMKATKRGRSASQKASGSAAMKSSPSPAMKRKLGRRKKKKSKKDDDSDATPSEEPTIVKKKPSVSSSTERSGVAEKRRALPCWFDGPLNDHDAFTAYAPRKGDILQVIPLCDGVEGDVSMTVEVVKADKLDELGVLAVLKFIDADDPKLAAWAQKFVTGSTIGDVSSFHFCKAKKCRAGNSNTLHIHQWKFINRDLDGEPLDDDDVESVPSDGEGTGVKVFDAGRVRAQSLGTSTMRKVAELRERLASHKSSAKVANPPGSGGGRSSGMAQSWRDLMSAKVDPTPSMKASGSKVTVAGLLADRAAERADKAAAARNALVAKKKTALATDEAKSSAEVHDDDVSDDRSGDDKDDGDSDSVFRKAP